MVDASAVLDLLLRGAGSDELSARILDEAETLHAPHLLDLEVAQVLRRYVRAGEVDSERASEALDDYLDLPIARYPGEPFLRRVWELRANVSAYDAAYIALAEALDAPLLTRDRKLASSFGHEAVIERV